MKVRVLDAFLLLCESLEMRTNLFRLSLLLCMSMTMLAAPAQADEFDFALVPTATFGSDEGFGTGGVASFYLRDDTREPYHVALTLNLFITSRLIQRHRVRLDWIDAFDLPLRLYAQAGYESTLTQNFCGYGSAVTCSEEDAQRAIDATALTGSEKEDALRRYHLMRFIRPYGEVLARYALSSRPHKFEVFGGMRSSFYLPGEIRFRRLFKGDAYEGTPFSNSRYQELNPDGEKGFSNVLQLGVAFDTRDTETRPSRGFFVEASARASSALWLSDWDHIGGNLSAATYVPLLEGSRTQKSDLVLAHRIVLDGAVGDVATLDMARVGGLTNFITFGGSDIGRGVREQRYLGKLKAIMQTELRYQFWELEWLGQDFVVGTAAFYDGSALRFSSEDEDPLRIVHGFGGGLRLLWNKDFSVRWDVGVSPHEGYIPRMYIRVGDAF